MAVWVTYSIHWYCSKGAEVKHLLLTTCTYYIIAILVDIAKRATADSAKRVSIYSRKKVGGPGPTLTTLGGALAPPGPPLATLLVSVRSQAISCLQETKATVNVSVVV